MLYQLSYTPKRGSFCRNPRADAEFGLASGAYARRLRPALTSVAHVAPARSARRPGLTSLAARPRSPLPPAAGRLTSRPPSASFARRATRGGWAGKGRHAHLSQFRKARRRYRRPHRRIARRRRTRAIRRPSPRRSPSSRPSREKALADLYAHPHPLAEDPGRPRAGPAALRRLCRGPDRGFHPARRRPLFRRGRGDRRRARPVRGRARSSSSARRRATTPTAA